MDTKIYWEDGTSSPLCLQNITGIVVDDSVFIIEVGGEDEETVSERYFIPADRVSYIIQTKPDAT